MRGLITTINTEWMGVHPRTLRPSIKLMPKSLYVTDLSDTCVYYLVILTTGLCFPKAPVLDLFVVYYDCWKGKNEKKYKER